MSLEARPYIGTWTLNGKELVQHTPDALIYLNGDTALPGCAKCSGKIDIQQFVTECSVDAGTEPGSASASFSLSIPMHHTDAIARDARYLLRPGLEVHVYFRGYFPVSGLFEHLAQSTLRTDLVADGTALESGDASTSSRAGSITPETPIPPTAQELINNLTQIGGARLNAEQRAAAEVIWREMIAGGMTPTFALAALNQAKFESNYTTTAQNGGDPNSPNIGEGAAYGLFQINRFGAATGRPTEGFQGRRRVGNTAQAQAYPDRIYDGFDPVINTRRVIFAVENGPNGRPYRQFKDENITASEMYERFFFSGLGAGASFLRQPTVFTEEQLRILNMGEYRTREGGRMFGAAWTDPGFNDQIRSEYDAILFEQRRAAAAELLNETSEARQALGGDSFLQDMGLAGLGLEKALAYPYYHVFHGVVTEVGHSWSGGNHSVSVSCSSMLHFWQYQNMSTNASVFGARPTNSKNKMSMVGHNFTGMHPYEIMYTLHHDTAGAAGGVGFALSSKTNQTAVSAVGGESLYSLTQRYWEERFKGRVTRLRMHGATGALFSTMAAAWFARTSSARLTAAMRNRYNEKKPDGTRKILAQAATLGLYNKNRRDALTATLQATRSQGGGDDNKPQFEINILEMQAFVSNISNWGQVNLFESSYESKLDIAQKVCEVTGFEFFQDVDGDFVFKPPMYNLDTSSSRVYRIEDIDIISLNTSEKEPQVTYMTVKGSHFKNLQGTGVENEWGVQGKFIDYRLVAKFGWRPGSYETAYFNDPKSMFFSAVNRMDMMNVGINSAQVQIPIRPEFRPGYPVYIPFLDCYYYCNSFSHSYSVGGQCSTSLQLVGKRAKFFAPGAPNREGARRDFRNGIDDIDLGDTLLPERPLEVWDQERQKPKLSGFPNVVMALDPAGLNPLFFVVGTEVQNLADPVVLKQLLDAAEKLQVVKSSVAFGQGRVYFMDSYIGATQSQDATPRQVNFYINESDATDQGQLRETPVPPGVSDPSQQSTNINVLAAALDYERLVEAQSQQTEDRRKDIRDLQDKISEKSAQIAEAREQDKDVTALIRDLDRLEETRRQKAREIQLQAQSNEDKWRDPSKGEGVAFLLEMIDRTGEAYRSRADFQGRTDLNSTVNLLDMLSDKKAIFSNGSQSGIYRYYSCSHPDPDQQGPKRFRYDGTNSARIVATSPESVEPRNQVEVLQYAANPSVLPPFPGAKRVEAELVKATPTVGIRVLTSTGPGEDGENRGGEVLPTSEIQELSFGKQLVTAVGNVTSTKKSATVSNFGKDLLPKLEVDFKVSNPDPTRSIQDVFSTVWAQYQANWQSAVDAVGVALGGLSRDDILFIQPEVPSFPSSLQAWSQSIDTSSLLNAFRYSGNDGAAKGLGKQSGKATLDEFVDQLSRSLAQVAMTIFGQTRAVIDRDFQLQALLGDEREQVVSAYNQTLGALYGVNLKVKGRSRKRQTKTKATETYSPVFPVSDAQGYEVIGNYRYGRGVDIDPDGVFAQLHKTDVFSLLSKDLVDNILRVFVRNESIYVPEYETRQRPDGTQVTVPRGERKVQGRAAEETLNREALRQLRDQNLTDKQILDRRLATLNEETGLLEFELSNYFADTSKDATQKVPVINAAYSLADLNIQQSGHVCQCRAAEANVLLSAFGQQDFVSFAPSTGTASDATGLEGLDEGSRFVAAKMADAAVAWEQQQQALRGQVLDRGGSPIVRQFQEFGDTVRDNVTNLSQNTAGQFQDLLDRQAQIRRNLGQTQEDE